MFICCNWQSLVKLDGEIVCRKCVNHVLVLTSEIWSTLSELLWCLHLLHWQWQTFAGLGSAWKPLSRKLRKYIKPKYTGIKFSEINVHIKISYLNVLSLYNEGWTKNCHKIYTRLYYLMYHSSSCVILWYMHFIKPSKYVIIVIYMHDIIFHTWSFRTRS